MSQTVRLVEHWIDGKEFVDSAAPQREITSPVDGTVVSTVRLGSTETVATAVASSKAAFSAWRDWSPVERGRLVQELGRRMREDADKFIAVEISETGKLEAEMRGSLVVAADYFEFYGGVVRAMFGDTIALGPDDHAFTTREPFGVVGMITPWNGPLTQASRGIAAAISAGNSVVIKPSEFTPSTTIMLARLATETGIPAGVINVVVGTGDAGAALVEQPDVRLIAFTGSVATGRVVATTAAGRLIPAILELGGKSPNIVFADADLDDALNSALTICASSGQQCAALSRLLVESSIYDAFVERVAAAISERTPGNRLAPMITPEQFDKVVDYFEVAEQDGARLVSGGHQVEGELRDGRYVEATVYADVTRDMRIFQEEIFGPVLTVTPFADEEEAVSLANDSDYGLVASVWTQDSSRALRVASRIDAGQVMVNGGRTGIETPFGGYKFSGLGREKGFESLRNYTQVKTTVISKR